jgi:hypothetical protein
MRRQSLGIASAECRLHFVTEIRNGQEGKMKQVLAAVAFFAIGLSFAASAQVPQYGTEINLEQPK